MNYISKAVDLAGLIPVAKACGISYQSVRKWEEKESLPRTEFTGETDYAKRIASLVNDEVTVAQLKSMKPKKPAD
jgi:hypothetical protein